MATEKPLHILGIAGSLRRKSYNTAALRAAHKLLPEGVINKPEVMIGSAATRFDAQGNLTDDATQGFIKALLAALADWTRRLRK